MLKSSSDVFSNDFYCRRENEGLFGKGLMPSPHSSVGTWCIADLRTEGRWFEARLCQYSFQELIIVITTGFIPLSLLSVVNNRYMRKQPVAWKPYCAEYWLTLSKTTNFRLFLIERVCRRQF